MGNIFIEADKDEIINRIDELHPNSKPMWGKMSVAQMLAHCIVPTRISSGELESRQTFLGKLFGNMAKKQMLASEQMKKGLPTAPGFIIKTEPDFYASQQGLKDAIQILYATDKTELLHRKHPFFGKLSLEEWGILNYKHYDHHLRQFGV
jgi:hypothetical protein